MPATRTRPASSAGEPPSTTSSALTRTLSISRPLPLLPRNAIQSNTAASDAEPKSAKSRRSFTLVPGGRTSLHLAENDRSGVAENVKALERAKRAVERDRRQSERQRYLAEKERVQQVQREAERRRLNLLKVEKERQAAERERAAAEAAHHSALRHARQIYSNFGAGLDWGFSGLVDGKDWTGDGAQGRAVKFSSDTVVVSRSEAKKMYNLTDAELSSLPYELKQNVLLFAFSDKYKVYFALSDIKECVRRRSEGTTTTATAMPPVEEVDSRSSTTTRHRPPPLALRPQSVIAVATQQPAPETPPPPTAFLKRMHSRKVSFELTRPPTRE